MPVEPRTAGVRDLCPDCGDVVGVYEPAVAVAGGQVVPRSSADARAADVYHEHCFGPTAPADGGAGTSVRDGEGESRPLSVDGGTLVTHGWCRAEAGWVMAVASEPASAEPPRALDR